MVVKKTLSKSRLLVRDYWRPGAFYGALIIICVGLLWFRLGSLTDGYSAAELMSLPGVRHLLDNPINAPFILLAHGLFYVGQDSLIWTRVAAAVVGLATLTCFYWLVRHWHGGRTAVFSTLLLASSAWFLHSARWGTPDVLMFLVFILVACGTWLKTTSSRVSLFISAALIAALFYVPGMVWLLIGGAIWQRRRIVELFRQLPATMTSCALIVAALIAPLGWAIYKTPLLAKVVVGLPANGWPQLLDSLERLAMLPVNVLARGPLAPEQWLGRLPLLDGFCIVMLVFGSYVYIRHYQIARTKLLAGVLAASAILISLGGEVSLSILVPFVYLLIAAGVGFLLDRWYAVFPRNTIAHGVALGLVCLAVGMSCWYGLRHYFIAWPQAFVTQTIFTTPDYSEISDTIKPIK